MKIEKINENKIRIIFSSDELIENNINIHSFLSNSIETQKLFLAILDIAHEDFGFDITNSNLSCETISFSNKQFVIIVTKNNITSSTETINYNKNTISHNFTKKNLQKTKINNDFEQDIFLYSFQDINDVFSFSDYLNNSLNTNWITSFFYKYNSTYFIKLILNNLTFNDKKTVLSFLLEYKNPIKLDYLTLIKLEEHSICLINNNALSIL